MQTAYHASKEATPIFGLRAIPLLRFSQRHARLWMTSLLILSDLAGLLLAFGLAILLRARLPGDVATLSRFSHQLPLLFIFIFVYALRGLYPAVGLSPVDELRLVVGSTSTVFLLIIAYTYWAGSSQDYSRLVFAFAWVFALILVQSHRWILRIQAVRVGAWGEPAAIVGRGPQVQRLVKYFNESLRFGIRPALVIDGHSLPDKSLPDSLKQAGIRTAILVLPEMSEALRRMIINERRLAFQRIVVISSLGWVGSLGVTPYDMEGVLGLEVQQNLLNPFDQFLKRTLDICVALIGGLLAFPAMLLTALAIKLDSPGPILYSQTRIGRRGKLIRVWKFRSMVSDADQILKAYLRGHPEMLEEWKLGQKIKTDPRITRVGKVLRRLSLDELPQLWNVLKGEMSLVGPRPIVKDEISHYNHSFTLYKQVSPGMTGLWQVSGRSDRGYDSRVRYDEYYIRNWSIWLDVYVLLRTILVVLRRDGAY